MKDWSTATKENSALAIRMQIRLEENDSVLGLPRFLETEIQSVKEDQENPYAPLPYFTDAIVGLSASKLLIHAQESLSSNNEALAALLWQRLEPLHEVYFRSHQRVKHLLHQKSTSSMEEQQFENSFWEILKMSCDAEGTNLQELTGLIDSLNFFESKRAKPLLFDTTLTLSSSTMSALHTLYSLLYNLRGLMAVHYNSKHRDSIYENLQIDNVKDYFHAPDLLTNESMLYYHFKSLQKAGSLSGQSVESLGQAFRNFLPHSHYLVSCLPEDFFTQQGQELLEQSLYTFQIDWLLGSPAGLLYRLREELIGLKEGYENTFWPELYNEKSEEALGSLQINCLLGSTHIRHVSEAA